MLGESARISSSSWRITDWPLFILRCLLLVLLSFLLAGPYFTQLSKAEQQGWILVKKTALKQAYAANKKQMDSLLKVGVGLHDFNVGFNALSLADTLADEQTGVADLNYISLIKQLNDQVPVGFSVYLFADQQLRHFVGDLPTIHFDLKYQAIQTADTLKNWSVAFNGKTYTANSSPSLTTYTATDSAKDAVPVQVLVHPLNSPDVNYIKGMLSAIAGFTKRKIVVQAWNNAADTGAVAGFWLAEEPMPEALASKLTKGANLLAYQTGKVQAVRSHINLADGALLGQNEALLYKRLAYVYHGAGTVWSDGFGIPLLTRTKIGDINHYAFYSRFDPQWTDLVWTSQFVKAMLPIVVPDQKNINFGFEDSVDDQRQLATQQQVVAAHDGTSASLKTNSKSDLAPVFWMAALLLLILERLLSFRKPISISHVKN